MAGGLSISTRKLVDRLLAGEALATARVISLLENRSEETAAVYEKIFPRTGRAHRVGLTGPPGAGKSTLVDGLAHRLLEAGRRPAIVAVDPTSPFTGGALLGDRIRMRSLPPEVFIRSMANRGEFGGLSRATGAACDVLDAAGADPILVETVGVGQSEVDIADAADTTVVILNPGTGDGVQLLKAGLMEVADVLVVNKADLDGADLLVEEIEATLEIRAAEGRPDLPVIRTVASRGEGVEPLLEAIDAHRSATKEDGRFEARRRHNIERTIRDLVEDHLRKTLWTNEGTAGELTELAERASRRQLTPYAAMATIVSRLERE